MNIDPLKTKVYSNHITVMADPIAVSSVDSDDIELYAQSLIQVCDHRVVFINYARENNLINDQMLKFLRILDLHEISSVIIVSSGTYHEHSMMENSLRELSCEILYVDYFLVLVYLHQIINQSQSKNISWNYSADKFLFLTGKYQKANRAWLLYKFHQAGLLDQCTWSLFVEHLDNTMDSTIPNLNQAEFMEFCARHARQLDYTVEYHNRIQWNGMNVLATHYPGFPYDAKLFGETAFRVISETRFKESDPKNTFFTEKTWITIFNSQPFIMASSPRSLADLQRKGFRTYQQYLPYADYDQIESMEDRLDAIVENTRYWVADIAVHREQIQQDVNHNFRQAILLARQNIEKIEHTASKYNVHEKFTELMPLDHWL